METKETRQSAFGAHVRVIPGWAWALAGIGFACAELFFNIMAAHRHDPPVAWQRALFGTILGVVFGCYLLLIGYVSRDARRNGMSSLLWVLISVLIPNGLGIILYFVLRELRQRVCPQCGSAMQSRPAPGSSPVIA